MADEGDVTHEIEALKSRYPMDDAAFHYIVSSPIEVQRQVLRDFKPKNEGEDDYSALVIGFTKKRRQTVAQNHFASTSPGYIPSRAPSRALPSQQEIDDLAGEVDNFRARYPFDDAAFNYIMNSSVDVQREILRSFKAKSEGQDDYSAFVISFAKRCRTNSGGQSWGGPAPHSSMSQGPPEREYEAFRQRFPFDEDTHNYLNSSPPEVRHYVLQNFKPPREGEPDYSALLITYCKRCRQNANDVGPRGRGDGGPPAWHQPPPPPPHQGYGYDGKGSSYGGGKGSYDDGRGKGAHDPYGKGHGYDGGKGYHPDAGRGYAHDAGKGYHPDAGKGYHGYDGKGYGYDAGKGYGYDAGKGYGYDAGKGHGFDPGKGYGHDGKGYGHDAGKGYGYEGKGYGHDAGKGYGHEGKGHRGRSAEEEALQGFRRRFPMDERAFNYLADCPPEVQREMLDTFAPPREDSDYSALVISLAKKCRARAADRGAGGDWGGPPKRLRVGY
ncbi:unnamed protein product [Polarella glacialis]|uniref:Uncharacterized protein n=2 Tax=Polarella glacialis TaxID=89957 RepID=A0A813FGZ1_POLGL|nr:unnamed protein product [Polarella glacialis]